MYSALNRINALAAFSLRTLTVLTFLCYLSTAFTDCSRPVSLNVANIVLKNVPNYVVSREKNDLGMMRFDLNADLGPVFNWNVQQLFVYLVAEYVSESNDVNQVILWDRTITRNFESPILKLRNENLKYYFWDNGIPRNFESPVLKLRNENLKYYFWDDGHGLIGNKNVSLKLVWNLVPNAGQLPLGPGAGSYRLTFPDEYTTSH